MGVSVQGATPIRREIAQPTSLGAKQLLHVACRRRQPLRHLGSIGQRRRQAERPKDKSKLCAFQAPQPARIRRQGQPGGDAPARAGEDLLRLGHHGRVWRTRAAFALRCRGPLNVHCQRCVDGRFAICEYNGRFTGATRVGALPGGDEVGWALEQFAGLPLLRHGNDRVPGQIVVRSPR